MTDHYTTDGAIPAWRVGEFVSSVDPSKCVLMLATGDEIAEYEAHRDFICWASPITSPVAQPVGWLFEGPDEPQGEKR